MNTNLLAASLDAILTSAVETGRVVGLDFAVAIGGTTIYRRAAGWADREASIPVTSATQFRLASLTKPIVSLAALRLAERGLFALDDIVSTQLPEFRPTLPSGTPAKINVRHLLSHTAGLTYGFLQSLDGPYRQAGISDGLDLPGTSMEEQLRRISTVPLSYPPGEGWGYSVATDVVGGLIERVTGDPLDAVVAREVTNPLGMSATTFRPDTTSSLAVPYIESEPAPSRMASDEIVPYGNGVVRFAPNRAWVPGSFLSGGAGLFGSLDDYLVFLEAVRRAEGPVSTKSRALLTTDTIGEVFVDAMGPGWGFGLGGAVLKDPVAAGSPQSAGTWHWSGAYGHNWFVDPPKQLSVVLITNTSFAGMAGSLPNELRDAVYAAMAS